MLKITMIAALLMATTALSPLAALAGEPLRGVALVIGESDYGALPDLTNPKSDARAMDDLLGDLGFDVSRVLDGDADELRDEIAQFVEDAADADVALVYYSGHGVELGGQNYLVPTDTDLATPESAGDSLVAVDALLAELAKTVPVTIVLLDACRTNAFPAGQLFELPGAGAPLPIDGPGLEAVRGPTPVGRPNVPADSLGMVIGFAASPGQPALDGEPGGNSPYAAALLKHFAAGGYSLGDLMTMVSEEVYLKTGARQLPWVNSSLRRVLQFGAPVEEAVGDEAQIRDGRRQLLLTIANAPETTRHYVETVASAEGVPLDALYGMLKVLGVDTTRTDQIEAQLKAGAERLKTLMDTQTGAAMSDVELKRLSDLADRAQAEGAIEVALRFREQASKRAEALELTVDANEANLKADRLQIGTTYAAHAKAASLTFDFDTAAAMWSKAYDQVVKWDDEAAMTYKWQEGNSLADAGSATGDAEIFDRAIAAYEQAAKVPSNSPRVNARIKTSIGDVYWTLGQRSVSTEPLNRAIEAYDAVQAVYDEVQANDESWVRLHTRRGLVYMALADREPGTESLLKARDEMEYGFKYVDPAVDPLGWADLKGNVGVILVSLGDRTGDPALYAEGADADRAALEKMPRETVPLRWATAQNNLGIALARIGEASEGTESLHDALDAFDLALAERKRDRVPVDWAATQGNIGNTLATIGVREGDPAVMEQAIAAYDAVLEVNTKDSGALAWAQALRNRGLTKKQLGVMVESPDWLEAGIADYQSALSVLSPDDTPMDWAQAQANLGIAALALADMTGRRADLELARDAYAAAYEIYSQVDAGYAEYFEGKLAEIDDRLD